MEANSEELSPAEPAHGGFDDFFRREYRSVVGLGAVLSGDRAVAEELAQEAFLAAFGRWKRLSRYDKPGAWVRKVVANRAVSVVRRRLREVSALSRLGGRREEATVELELFDDAFWSTVRALPRRQAQCLALHYVEDRSVADIALILGISSSTVKVHLHDGRRDLARRLDLSMEDSP